MMTLKKYIYRYIEDKFKSLIYKDFINITNECRNKLMIEKIENQQFYLRKYLEENQRIELWDMSFCFSSAKVDVLRIFI